MIRDVDGGKQKKVTKPVQCQIRWLVISHFFDKSKPPAKLQLGAWLLCQEVNPSSELIVSQCHRWLTLSWELTWTRLTLTYSARWNFLNIEKEIRFNTFLSFRFCSESLTYLTTIRTKGREEEKSIEKSDKAPVLSVCVLSPTTKQKAPNNSTHHSYHRRDAATVALNWNHVSQELSCAKLLCEREEKATLIVSKQKTPMNWGHFLPNPPQHDRPSGSTGTSGSISQEHDNGWQL